jgi:hypothetical protein
MKCVACGQRKGKRQCPAKAALICAQCCGEKRVLEIDCPESCGFLKVGRQHESSLHTRFLFTSDPQDSAKRKRVLSEFREIFLGVEYFLASERRTTRSLTDEEVGEALSLLLDGLRTEEKGIIYERSSSNPYVDGLRRRLGELIEAHRNPEEPDAPRIKLRDAIEILESVAEVMETYLRAVPAVRGYVDSLVRIYPREEGSASSGSSIIIPGR